MAIGAGKGWRTYQRGFTWAGYTGNTVTTKAQSAYSFRTRQLRNLTETTSGEATELGGVNMAYGHDDGHCLYLVDGGGAAAYQHIAVSWGSEDLDVGPYFTGASNSKIKVCGRLNTTPASSLEIRYAKSEAVLADVGSYVENTDYWETGDIDSTLTDDETFNYEVGSLDAGTKYYFDVVVDGATGCWAAYDDDDSNVVFPSCSTFATTPTSLNFATTVDQNARDSDPAGIWAEIDADAPDIIFQMGDYGGCEPGDVGFDSTDSATCNSIDSPYYRVMSGNYRLHVMHDSDYFANVASKYPIFHMWDDHDHGINNSSKFQKCKNLIHDAFVNYRGTLVEYLDSPDDYDNLTGTATGGSSTNDTDTLTDTGTTFTSENLRPGMLVAKTEDASVADWEWGIIQSITTNSITLSPLASDWRRSRRACPDHSACYPPGKKKALEIVDSVSSDGGGDFINDAEGDFLARSILAGDVIYNSDTGEVTTVKTNAASNIKLYVNTQIFSASDNYDIYAGGDAFASGDDYFIFRAPINYSLSLGTFLDVFVIDNRSMRDPSGDYADMYDGLRYGTSLGDDGKADSNHASHRQRDWLVNGLNNSTASWRFVVSATPVNATIGDLGDALPTRNIGSAPYTNTATGTTLDDNDVSDWREAIQDSDYVYNTTDDTGSYVDSVAEGTATLDDSIMAVGENYIVRSENIDPLGNYDPQDALLDYLIANITAINLAWASGDRNFAGIDDGTNSNWPEMVTSTVTQNGMPSDGTWSEGTFLTINGGDAEGNTYGWGYLQSNQYRISVYDEAGVEQLYLVVAATAGQPFIKRGTYIPFFGGIR